MGDISSDCIVYQQDTGFSRESNSPLEYKEILVETPATADNGDTILLSLKNYGINNLKTIKEFVHSTNYSVIVRSGTSTTTSNTTNGTATITLTGGFDDTKRVFLIGGY